MWIQSYSKVYPDIKKENIWRAWSDVKNWPKWDTELEYCKIEGDFVAGNRFILKPKSGPKVNIIVSEMIPNERFTDYCRFPGATMHDAHLLEDTQEGLRITNTISMKGPLQFIWVKLVAKNIVNGLPTQMDNLVAYARSL